MRAKNKTASKILHKYSQILSCTVSMGAFLVFNHLNRHKEYQSGHATAALKDECLDLLALSKKAELLFDDGVSHHILRVVQR